MAPDVATARPRPDLADHVGAVHQRAVAAGATSVHAPAASDSRGRGCTLRDREGNRWSFGTYAPGDGG